MKKQKALAGALAKRLASRKVSDEAVAALSHDIAAVGRFPIDVDICMYGICIDYMVDRKDMVKLIDRLHTNPRLGGIKIFPKGILDPDKFLVQVEQAFSR